MCLILSWFPKFITKNPASASNFPSQIWEILIVFDLVQKSWSCLILSRFCKFITKVSSTNHSALSRGVNDTIEEDPTIWWLNRADWEIVIYIGWAWQGQISSNLVSTGCQSEHIMLCQQLWRMMLLRRIMPWATWLRLSTAIMHYWLPCKIWSAIDNPHLRYRLWIFAHFALSTGVDNDANEEQDAVVLVTKYGWLGSWNA